MVVFDRMREAVLIFLSPFLASFQELPNLKVEDVPEFVPIPTNVGSNRDALFFRRDSLRGGFQHRVARHGTARQPQRNARKQVVGRGDWVWSTDGRLVYLR